MGCTRRVSGLEASGIDICFWGKEGEREGSCGLDRGEGFEVCLESSEVVMGWERRVCGWEETGLVW